VAGVIAALGGRTKGDRWRVMLIAGLVGICVGAITFVAPGVTALVLVVVALRARAFVGRPVSV
jgi:uncharacterized membrane protein HdeD (DUF308 family)